MKNRIIILLLTLLSSNICFSYGKANHQCLDTSLIQLIANPDKYHGELVRVIGVVKIEFEGNQIFTSKEHYEYSISKNALWINLNSDCLGVSKEELKKYNGQYVLIEGIFDKNNTGHMGMNSGSINNISRFDLWEKTIKKIKRQKRRM